MTHVVLFFFISAENTYFLNIRIQKPPQNGVAERTSATGD
jgi:hypothetical protein